ncbi:tetratricopeptide repeat-containing response regulator [Teredinibacter purpureus]|uniref:tetratricopeptide repeat-containing response regulator n=1 Tax=Teredinibacter purpureus TaxID=2731756 RepID=UPI000A4A7336|nr:tetratricopeptide repeat-containing response regulator [Teredinibacter purpureus]
MGSQIIFSKLAILVVDDFSSFRNTVNTMLTNLGVSNVGMAATAREAISYCENRRYDVILCDYNLGSGRTGQHVLEELKHRRLITRHTIFIIVSAESSRNIVMCSYDCEPDDYLMKPITAKMLEQRMGRLLQQRLVLSPAYKALDAHDYPTASEILIDLSLEEDRYSTIAQKLLGSIFIQTGELDKAERLYTRALEVRQLDWARLGLAKVKQARGELDVSGDWLDTIVDDNPLYLPAYDVLAENWRRKGELFNVQFTVQRAVDISPMSILRQKYLADVATDNNDLITAITAQRRSVKLGQLSCHGLPEDHFTFARLSSLAVEREMDVDPNISREALAILDLSKEQYELSEAQLAQCNLLTGRIHALENRQDLAQQFLQAAEDSMDDLEVGIKIDLDRLLALQSMNLTEKFDELLLQLKDKYADDQSALEQLDVFLNEPASDSNREFVAAINREGIELYNGGEFDNALACFEKARKLFPKHVGIQLNIVQALIGKMKMGTADPVHSKECSSSLDLVSSLIDEGHPQFDRFRRLRTMASAY